MTEYDGLGFTAKVILFLYRNGRIVRRAFKNAGFSYPDAVNALERLESVGVTMHEATGDYRGTVYWSLTEKGKKVAEILIDLDEFIRSD